MSLHSRVLPLRRLGRTNRQVTELGLGGAGLNGVYGKNNDDATAVACIHKAFALGVRYIDTSPLYGESERRIGLSLAEGGYRDQLFLATKTGTGSQPKDYSGDGTRRSVERSLRLLRTDRLDLVQIHDPDGEAHWREALASGGALDTLLTLKEQGVVGAIGLGVRSHALLLQAIRHGAFDTILTYADFNPVQQTARDTLFGEAATQDVAVILGSPLLFGYLSDRPWHELLREHGSDGSGAIERGALRVRQWAASQKTSTLDVALQYALREKRISTVLVGAATPEEIEQNVRAATRPLPDSLWRRLADDLNVT